MSSSSNHLSSSQINGALNCPLTITQIDQMLEEFGTARTITQVISQTATTLIDAFNKRIPPPERQTPPTHQHHTFRYPPNPTTHIADFQSMQGIPGYPLTTPPHAAPTSSYYTPQPPQSLAPQVAPGASWQHAHYPNHYPLQHVSYSQTIASELLREFQQRNPGPSASDPLTLGKTDSSKKRKVTSTSTQTPEEPDSSKKRKATSTSTPVPARPDSSKKSQATSASAPVPKKLPATKKQPTPTLSKDFKLLNETAAGVVQQLTKRLDLSKPGDRKVRVFFEELEEKHKDTIQPLQKQLVERKEEAIEALQKKMEELQQEDMSPSEIKQLDSRITTLHIEIIRLQTNNTPTK